MPNHCENDLYLHGTEADVAEVLAFIGADRTPPQFDFNAVIPYPDPFKAMDDEHAAIPDLVGVYRDSPEWPARLAARQASIEVYKAKWGTTSDGFNSGGYEWRRAAWGTKWGAYDVARRDYDGSVIVSFQTAWGPSRSIILALAARFPKVTFSLEYFERGMEFAGGFRCPSEDDYYGDVPWEPGIVTHEWEGPYRGMRGG